VLTVANYGIQMEGGTDAYELYWQGSNATGTEGLGIGLFVAKQIVDAHGGEISHESKLVSDYNVPLLKPYLTKVPLKDEILLPKFQAELERLTASGQYNTVVAMGEHRRQKYDPTIGEITSSIRKKTWRVTFKVKIPAKR
jgi:signal transduction histidine kinase